MAGDTVTTPENPAWWSSGEFSRDDPVPSAYVADENDGHTYVLGQTRDASDVVWGTSGLQLPSLSSFFGLSGGQTVTGRDALQQAAALICLDVLAQDISKATLRLYRKTTGKLKGGQEIVEPKQHRLARMLALEPNERHTWAEWVQMMVYHLVMTSNCYAWVERNRVGDPISIFPVMPGRVEEFVAPRTREIFYEILAGTEQEVAMLGTDRIIAPARDVLHVRQRMLDGFWGYSTLKAGQSTLRLGQHLGKYEENLFSESGMVRGFFSRKDGLQTLQDEQFQRVRGQLRKLLVRDRNPQDPVLLEDGITYNKVSMTASEADMTKALDAHIEMVCKLWRMPPHKAMHLNAVKYENLTAMEKVYVRDTLMPLCVYIEQRLSKTLLTEEERLEFCFMFDRDQMSIFDDKVENERVKGLAAAGIISHNEARMDQGYNPRPGGDVYSLPVNTVLVDDENEVVASGAAAQGQQGTPASTDNTEPDDPATDTAKGLRLVANGN